MSYTCSLDSTAPWRLRVDLERWGSRISLPRHRHAHGYAALIVSGGYEESGSFGRYRARAGGVLLHRPFDAHLDRFGLTGARILNLPLRSQPAYGLGRVADPARIVQLARQDLIAATDSLFEQLTPVTPAPTDWPDLLASDLINDPTLQLREWAERYGLAQESLARGFRKVFAITPAAFRAEARAHSAWAGIRDAAVPLADIAEAAGFADQAHMTRAISELTGCPPGHWRRLNRFKTPSGAVT
jgi:AraC-like DNA-binding protein